MRRILLLITLLAPFAAHAQSASTPPPLPARDVPEEQPPTQEEEVTIRTEGESSIEEHRVNGRLYAVKITPTSGLPYYLIDQDGDGLFETYSNSLQNPNITQWTLFRW